MAFIGTPLDTRNTFQSLVGKRFSGDGSTTAFTLDVAPSSTLDLEVFVGNVRQDPNSAYTLSGTTLSFTGAPPSGTNNIYVVHQAKSVGTIDVPASGVQAGSLASSVLTGQTDIGAAIADADLFLVDDGAGGTLRKTAASRIKTYIGDNTPAFHIRKSSNQTGISSGSWTKITFDDEVYDTDSAFASNKFTAPSAGKYFFTTSAKMNDNGGDHDLVGSGIRIYVNGAVAVSIVHFMNNNPSLSEGKTISAVLNLSASDYVEVYVYAQDGAGGTTSVTGGNDRDTFFMGFKLIT